MSDLDISIGPGRLKPRSPEADVEELTPPTPPTPPPPLAPPVVQDPQPDTFNRLAGLKRKKYTAAELAAGVSDMDDALVRSFNQAVLVDPEVRAEATQLGIQFDLPPGVVESNIDKIRQFAAVKQLRRADLARVSPILARQMLNPDFAALAHDDIDGLSFLEGIAGGWDVGLLENELSLLSHRRAADGESPALLKQIAALTERIQALPAPGGFRFDRILSHPLDTVSEMASGTGRLVGQLWPSIRDSAPEAIIGAVIGGAAGSLAGPGPGTTAGAILGAKILGGAELVRHIYIQERGASYNELRKLGISHTNASDVSVGVGAFNTALEFVGFAIVAAPARAGFKTLVRRKLDGVVRDLTRGQLARRFATGVLKASTGEGATEAMQEVGNFLGEEVALQLAGNAENAFETAASREALATRIADVFQEAFGSTLLLGGISSGVRSVADLQRVKRAEVSQEFVKSLAAGVKNSKTAERSPSMFERFMSRLANGTPVENLYFDAAQFSETLAQAGVDRETLRAILPEVEAQLDEAKASGGDVVIPTAVYAAKIAGTPLHESLSQDARISPDLPSLRTVAKEQASAEQLATEAEQTLKKHVEAADTFTEEARAVEAAWLKRLETTGRLKNPEEARTAARLFRNWVVVTAESLGITPNELAAEFPNPVVGKASEVQSVVTSTARDERNVAALDIAKGKFEDTGGVWNELSAEEQQRLADKVDVNFENAKAEARAEFDAESGAGAFDAILGKDRERRSAAAKERKAARGVRVRAKVKAQDEARAKTTAEERAATSTEAKANRASEIRAEAKNRARVRFDARAGVGAFDALSAAKQEPLIAELVERIVAERAMEEQQEIANKKEAARSFNAFAGSGAFDLLSEAEQERLIQKQRDQIDQLDRDDAGVDAAIDAAIKEIRQQGKKSATRTIEQGGETFRFDVTEEDGPVEGQRNIEFEGRTYSVDVTDVTQDAESLAQNEKTLAELRAAWEALGVRNFMSEKDGTIKLHEILVPVEERKQGLGTRAMDLLTDFADRTGQRITLTASKDLGGTSVARLKRFYKRFGFVENKGRNRDFTISDTMFREPVKRALQQATQTNAFRAWFGNSAIVDEQGAPQVLFHQTSEPRQAGIERRGFDISIIGARGNDEGVPNGVFLKTTDQDISVTRPSEGAPVQIPLFARVENPLRVADRTELRSVLEQDPEYKQLATASDELDARRAEEYDKLEKKVDAEVDAQTEAGADIDADIAYAELDAFIDRWKDENRVAAAKARVRATEVLRELGHDGVILKEDVGSFGRETSTVIVLDPTQVKSVNNRGTFDRSDPNILQQPQAPAAFFSALTREIGAVGTKSATAAGWKQTITGLIKKGKIKEDEVVWTGLRDWLDLQEGKVSKEQVLEFLSANGIQVETVTLGDTVNIDSKYALPEVLRAAEEAGGFAEDELVLTVGNDGDAYRALTAKFPELLEDENWAETVVRDIWGKTTLDAKFAQYTLPGGKNYREKVMTLPDQRHADDLQHAKEIVDASVFAAQGPVSQEKFLALQKRHDMSYGRALSIMSGERTTPAFRGGHFDEPNVVAHIRMDDDVDVIGRLVLRIHEIQSDWGAKGRAEGFKEGLDRTEFSKLDAQVEGLRGELAERIQELTKTSGIPSVAESLALPSAERATLRDRRDALHSEDARFVELSRQIQEGNERLGNLGEALAADLQRVPRAPFVETTKGWLNLALKQILLEAVNGNYDAVAFINGEQAADLYDLSKQVDRIEVTPLVDSEFELSIGLEDGATIELTIVGEKVTHASQGEFEGRALSDVIGKDPAVKAIEEAQRAADFHAGWQVLDAKEADIEAEGAEGFVLVDVNGEFLRDSGGGVQVFDDREDADAEVSVMFVDAQNRGEIGVMRDDDLKIGGEGMRAFYDRMVPQALAKLSKKVGGPSVDTVALPIGDGAFVGQFMVEALDAPPGESLAGPFDTREEAEAVRRLRSPELLGAQREQTRITQQGIVDQPALQITDELRASVEAGLPLFQGERGEFFPQQLTTVLHEGADFSTVLHEMSHFFFEVHGRILESPNPPQAIVDDFNTFLEWTGVESLDVWRGMSFEQRRPHTEAFAFAFEVYLFEGKAPSVGMARLFDKVRRFMTRVYGDVLAVLNPLYRETHGRDLPGLTKEMRDVFGRMLAAEQEVTRADAVRGFAPLFETQEESGLSDEEWGAYTEALSEARDASMTDVAQASLRQMQWLEGARGRELKKLQTKRNKFRKVIKAEVEKEVRDRPVYRLVNYLRRGEIDLPDGGRAPVEGVHKLDTELTRAMLPEGAELQRDLSGLTVGAGLDPDVVAELFGFENGREVVQALVEAKPLGEEVRGITDVRMLNEHGDLINEDQIERTIQEALHNPARARFVAVELRFLQRTLQPVRIVTAAARLAARRILGRKRIRDIRPSDFEAAEMRARRAAEKASKTGDPQAAITAKHQELLQFHMAKEALRIKSELEKTKGFVRKFNRTDKKLAATRNVDYVGIGRAIIARLGMGPPAAPAKPHMDNVEKHAPELLVDLKELIEPSLANETNWQDLPLDDFQLIEDTLRALWFLSRRDRQIEVDGEMDERTTVVERLLAGLDAPAAGRKGRTTSEAEKKRADFGSLLAWFKHVESWALARDGGEPGPVHRYLFSMLREPVNAYEDEKLLIVRELHRRLNAHDFGDNRVKIHSTELNFTFRNKAELVGAVRHAGNESNLRKLLLGHQMVEQPEERGGEIDTAAWWVFIDRMIEEGVLTKADFDLVQHLWDVYDTLLPRSQKAHFDIYGYRFEEIPKVPIETPWGTFRGGYVPLKYDPYETAVGFFKEDSLSTSSQDYQKSFPSTGRGFTFTRVVDFNEPLLLDVRMDAHTLDEHLRFIHLQRPGRDVLRLLRDPQVADALKRIDPNIVKDTFLPWIDSVLKNQVLSPGGPRLLSRWLTVLRRRSGLATMFGNVAVGVQQLTGIGNALLFVKLGFLRGAAALYARTFFSGTLVAEIMRLSTFMRLRLGKALGQIRDDIDVMLKPGWLGRAEQWSLENGYFLQRWFQQPVDVITWKGRFDQSIAQGKTEKQAVVDADTAVRRSQSSGQAADLSRLEKGHPLVRLITQFSTFWVATANAVLNRPTVGSRIAAGAVAVAFAGLAAGAVTQALRGGWEDEDDDGVLWDDVTSWAFSETLGATVSITAPVLGPMLLRPITGEFGGRITMGAGAGALERALGTPWAMLTNAIDDEKDLSGRLVRDFGMLISLLTGIPVTGLTDRARFLIDAEDDADRARGVLVGR